MTLLSENQNILKIIFYFLIAGVFGLSIYLIFLSQMRKKIVSDTEAVFFQKRIQLVSRVLFGVIIAIIIVGILVFIRLDKLSILNMEFDKMLQYVKNVSSPKYRKTPNSISTVDDRPEVNALIEEIRLTIHDIEKEKTMTISAKNFAKRKNPNPKYNIEGLKEMVLGYFNFALFLNTKNPKVFQSIKELSKIVIHKEKEQKVDIESTYVDFFYNPQQNEVVSYLPSMDLKKAYERTSELTGALVDVGLRGYGIAGSIAEALGRVGWNVAQKTGSLSMGGLEKAANLSSTFYNSLISKRSDVDPNSPDRTTTQVLTPTSPIHQNPPLTTNVEEPVRYISARDVLLERRCYKLELDPKTQKLNRVNIDDHVIQQYDRDQHTDELRIFSPENIHKMTLTQLQHIIPFYCPEKDIRVCVSKNKKFLINDIYHHIGCVKQNPIPKYSKYKEEDITLITKENSELKTPKPINGHIKLTTNDLMV